MMDQAAVLEYDVPKECKRDLAQKWNGWGYADSYFFIDKNRDVSFTGERYEMSGTAMPNFRPWFEANLGVDLSYKTPSQEAVRDLPVPTLNEDFIDWLRSERVSFSTDARRRLNRSHGHTCQELMRLRHGAVGRIADVVVWPRSSAQVERVVEAANGFDVALIPIGGGTSVSDALECPADERRCVVSVDTSEMRRVLWVDSANLLCRAEAGIVGVDLEQQLNAAGFTTGHEPDSNEFSSLGGWVATRASGMRKNKYGNIEDLLVHLKVVTSRGVLEKSCQVPRISAGPDIHHFVLGSEGTLGVITEVTFKICALPECKKFGSVLLPRFDPDGVDFLREVARQGCEPASIRLVDNEQFVMGQAMKVAPASWFGALADRLKKLYVTQWKRFDPKHMCAVTIVFEGSKAEVEVQEKRIYEIAKQFGGMPAGEENGRYGYRLTFAIAYLRDLGFEHSCMGESFETAVPWDKTLDLCRNVKELLERKAKELGVLYPILASCRVTQLYHSGACVYFYLGFNYRGLSNPVEVYEKLEEAARDEILACGGSISHHHGVGKLRRRWLPQTIGSVGMAALQALKQQLDPNNVFACDNLYAKAKL